MRVAVKYCGGCNPRYDRAALIKRLRDEVPDVGVVRPGGEEVDVVAVMCGCAVACAEHSHLHGQLGKVILTKAADYDSLRRLVTSTQER